MGDVPGANCGSDRCIPRRFRWRQLATRPHCCQSSWSTRQHRSTGTHCTRGWQLADRRKSDRLWWWCLLRLRWWWRWQLPLPTREKYFHLVGRAAAQRFHRRSFCRGPCIRATIPGCLRSACGWRSTARHMRGISRVQRGGHTSVCGPRGWMIPTGEIARLAVAAAVNHPMGEARILADRSTNRVLIAILRRKRIANSRVVSRGMAVARPRSRVIRGCPALHVRMAPQVCGGEDKKNPEDIAIWSNEGSALVRYSHLRRFTRDLRAQVHALASIVPKSPPPHTHTPAIPGQPTVARKRRSSSRAGLRL